MLLSVTQKYLCPPQPQSHHLPRYHSLSGTTWGHSHFKTKQKDLKTWWDMIFNSLLIRLLNWIPPFCYSGWIRPTPPLAKFSNLKALASPNWHNQLHDWQIHASWFFEGLDLKVRGEIGLKQSFKILGKQKSPKTSKHCLSEQHPAYTRKLFQVAPTIVTNLDELTQRLIF